MFIPDEMKLNRFKEVSLPSARDFFRNNGVHSMPDNQYSGDDVAPMPMNKVDSISDFERYCELKQHEEDEKSSQSAE